MIDSDIIEAYPQPERDAIKKAMGTLHAYGVLEAQIRKENDGILTGDADQPIKEAARDLLKVRTKTQSLASFDQLCNKYFMETQDA